MYNYTIMIAWSDVHSLGIELRHLQVWSLDRRCIITNLPAVTGFRGQLGWMIQSCGDRNSQIRCKISLLSILKIQFLVLNIYDGQPAHQRLLEDLNLISGMSRYQAMLNYQLPEKAMMTEINYKVNL